MGEGKESLDVPEDRKTEPLRMSWSDPGYGTANVAYPVCRVMVPVAPAVVLFPLMVATPTIQDFH